MMRYLGQAWKNKKDTTIKLKEILIKQKFLRSDFDYAAPLDTALIDNPSRMIYLANSVYLD